MSIKVKMYTETTPNPNTLKFVTNQVLVESGSVDFPTLESTISSELAQKLYDIDGVFGVFFSNDFVTVTKNGADWSSLIPQVKETIKTHLEAGNPVISDESIIVKAIQGSTDIETEIIKIIDTEIRPAVAMDGGDIIFRGYSEGVVALQMQGSCSGCPSSTATLKQGIERRLKEVVPEVQEVIAI
ncbi:MAG: NifU family protein [Calditrichaeota bacterium]|nr:MAG: NifU family protein [Calditrichota bacterium]